MEGLNFVATEFVFLEDKDIQRLFAGKMQKGGRNRRESELKDGPGGEGFGSG